MSIRCCEPWKKGLPGASCCANPCCIVATDWNAQTDFTQHFTQQTGSAANTTWTAGTVAISGGPAAISADTVHPQSPYPARVQAMVSGPSAAKIRLFLSWDPTADDAVIVELIPGTACGTLNIIHRVSGTETTQCTTPAPRAVANAWHKLAGCYDPDTGLARAWVVPDDTNEATEAGCEITSHTDGSTAGFGTASTTGTVSFDDFEFFRLWYYGDGTEEENEYYGGERHECEPCESYRCAWAVGHFDDEDNLACEWWEDTADWSIDETAETISTTVSTSTILHKSPYRQHYRSRITIAGGIDGEAIQINEPGYRHTLLTAVAAENAGRVLRMIVAAADEDNYLALEFTVSSTVAGYCGSARLINRDSGSDTAVSPVHILRGLVAGDTIYTATEYDHETGTFRAFISTRYPFSRITPSAEPSGLDWGRELAAWPSATLDWHGDYVGIGTAGGTGEATVSRFQAGCTGVPQDCTLEDDQLTYDVSSWRSDNWEKESGTWPTRGNDADGFYVSGSNACTLRLQNPVTGDTEQNHTAYFQAKAVTLTAGDEWAFWCGGSTGADAHRVRFTANSIDPPNITARLERMIGGSPTLLDSVTYDAESDIYAPWAAHLCRADDLVAASFGSRVLQATSQPDAPGGYAGFTLNPSGTLGMRRITTYRHGLINPDSPFVQVCAGCPGQCGYCLNDEWPSEHLIDFPSFTANSGWYDCQCSLFGGPVYATYDGTSCHADGTAEVFTVPVPSGLPRCTGVTSWDLWLGNSSTLAEPWTTFRAVGGQSGQVTLLARYAIGTKTIYGLDDTIYYYFVKYYGADVGDGVDCEFDRTGLTYIGCNRASPPATPAANATVTAA